MTDTKANNAESRSTPQLTEEVALRLADTIAATLDKACKASPGKPASKEAKKLAAQRVLKKVIDYDLLEAYPLVIWDEIITVVDRILAYPVTTLYRRHLKDAPKEILSAWQIHSQSLRVGEIYIIQDRTSALLKFLYQVASDAGIPATNYEKKFEKEFKKAFERRLRERHRLVHAHERQSLESRIISLSGAARPDKEQLEKILTDILTDIIPILTDVMTKQNREPPQSMDDVAALHEQGAVREAAEMLDLVGAALLRTLNLLPAAP